MSRWGAKLASPGWRPSAEARRQGQGCPAPSLTPHLSPLTPHPSPLFLGYSLKAGKALKTMKHDMAGSSVALGLFTALAELQVDYPLECWLAIAENHLHRTAYRYPTLDT